MCEVVSCYCRYFVNFIVAEYGGLRGGGKTALVQRGDAFRSKETELITTPDEQFRFHSGLPTVASSVIGALDGEKDA